MSTQHLAIGYEIPFALNSVNDVDRIHERATPTQHIIHRSDEHNYPWGVFPAGDVLQRSLPLARFKRLEDAIGYASYKESIKIYRRRCDTLRKRLNELEQLELFEGVPE